MAWIDASTLPPHDGAYLAAGKAWIMMWFMTFCGSRRGPQRCERQSTIVMCGTFTIAWAMWI